MRLMNTFHFDGIIKYFMQQILLKILYENLFISYVNYYFYDF